ncbi:MAG: fatty acid desaturase [Acidobacteria bacterium]|nr:fatty acid desaturase [Acidobacteriota bacterium]
MLLTVLYCLLAIGLTVQLSAFATSIYLHRCLAHRALQLHPLVAFLVRLELWLATGIVPRQWVAVHRKHHRFADQEGDPHSPVLKGLWRILLGNAFYYAREARDPETVARFAPDVGTDWLDRHVFRSGLVGATCGLVLFVLLLGPLAGSISFFLQAGIYIFLNAVINGAGHAVGYRNFDNTATNMPRVALITAGEGLHNNHHAFPTSARFSFRPGEWDPSWPVIRLLAWLRLARPLRAVPENI